MFRKFGSYTLLDVFLQKIVSYPPTTVLNEKEKDLVWQFRFYLTSQKKVCNALCSSFIVVDIRIQIQLFLFHADLKALHCEPSLKFRQLWR